MQQLWHGKSRGHAHPSAFRWLRIVIQRLGVTFVGFKLIQSIRQRGILSRQAFTCSGLLLTYVISKWYFFRRKSRNLGAFIPKAHPFLLKSGTELASMLRKGDVTSQELVDAYIYQIHRVNPHLNAMVCQRFDQARLQAQAVDEILASKRSGESKAGADDLPPFFGVPCTVKEVFEMEGMGFTGGLVTRSRNVGKISSPVIARIQRAGFIILGTGNISENCMWMEADNKVYGVTGNPYGLDRTSGGSSGGEAALLSAAGAPVSFGSDVGGSIRIPAYFNGIFGHKPTGGTVPNTRTHPPVHGKVTRYCQIGPFARHAVDLMPMLRLVAGADGANPLCTGPLADALSDPHSVQLRGMKVVDCTHVFDDKWIISSRDQCLLDSHDQVVRVLKDKYKCHVETLDLKEFPELNKAFDIWSAMLSEAQPHPFRVILSEGKRQIWVLWEMLKLFFHSSDHTLPALGLALVERVPEMLPAYRDKLLKLGSQLKDKLVKLVGDGVLLWPSLPRPAPKQSELLWRLFDCSATCIHNVMEFPVTQVPLGLSRQGLPLGIQIVANHHQDFRSIAVALALEREFGGWTPPPIAFSVECEFGEWTPRPVSSLYSLRLQNNKEMR